MFPLHGFVLRFGWLLFLFISFWPWEKNSGQAKKTSLEIPQNRELLKTIRVALFYEKSQVSVEVQGPYEIKALPDRKPLGQGLSLPSSSVRPSPSGIRLGSFLYEVSGFRIASQGKEVQVGDRKYRNAISVIKNPLGSLTIVNEVDVEDYLKGVLPVEVNPEWPEEALKAQAVVSRTYAVFKNIENKDFPFSLSSDVGSQVYGGKVSEKPSTSRAVEKTRGEILVYGGKIFPAFFHSTCGGRTTRADYQWKVEAHPSLRGVHCPFCQGSKYYAWKAEFGSEEVQNLLSKKGRTVPEIRNIIPDQLDESGRPQFFVIEHVNGSEKIPANEFRLALGVDRMRSTQVKVTKETGRFLFKGKGWGHGVGMCQFGAKYLAQLGYRYTDILRYYYPDSEIRNLEDFPTFAEGGPASEEKRENPLKNLFGRMKSYFEEY